MFLVPCLFILHTDVPVTNRSLCLTTKHFSPGMQAQDWHSRSQLVPRPVWSHGIMAIYQCHLLVRGYHAGKWQSLCTLRNHMTGWKRGGSHGGVSSSPDKNLIWDCSNTPFPSMLALSVLLGLHGQKNKRSKLSEHTERKEVHAAQMVWDIAGQRDRKHHASFKVKADGRSLLTALSPAQHVSLYMTEIKIKLLYKLQYFFSSELLLQ